METEPDATTLRACREGDRAALGSVLLAHAPMLERFLSRLVGPSPDVADLLQQTFAAAIVAFPRFRGDARVSTWLCSIAVHVAHRWLRGPERRRTVALELVSATRLRDDTADPGDRVDRRRLQRRLYEHLDAIGPKKRIAFVLHVLEERPIEEVAALMGATRAATKSRIFWARRALVRAVVHDSILRELLERKEHRR